MIKKRIRVLAGLTAMGMIAHGAEVPLNLPEQFRVFYSNDITPQIAAALRSEDRELLLPDGKKIKALPIERQADLIDLNTLRPDPKTQYAALTAAIHSDRPGVARIGLGADWWFDCFCNGQYIFGTTQSGNGVWPPAKDNYIFDLPLRAGRNELVIFTRSGTGGWSVAVGNPPPTDEPDRPRRQPEPPQVLFGPYLTNPGTTSATVSYVLSGRQPLEFEYREAGTTEWIRLRHLRGGQLIDDAVVERYDLENLKPDTRYEYRAIKRMPPEYRVGEPDRTRSFRTFSEEPKEFSFWVMGDTHLPKRAKLARLQRLLDKRPELGKAELFVHIGDFASNMDDFQHEVFDSFLKRIPAETFIVALRGNHEFDGAQATHFLTYLGMKNRRSYGAFRLGPAFFVVLDTGHHLPADSINPYQRYTGLNELDTLLEEQRRWLAEVVKSPEFARAKFRVVLAHVAPFSHSDSFHYIVPRLHRLTDEFFRGNPPKHPVQLWISGHIHRYTANRPDPEWGFPVITLGGGTKTDFAGAALHVTVRPEELRIRVIDSDGSIRETFRVPATQGSTELLAIPE